MLVHLRVKDIAKFMMWIKFPITTGIGIMLLASNASALPAFARQTGQSCVACHVGGQYPELTPFGRQFKLTGYTLGQRTNPLAAMVIADYAKTAKNKDGSGAVVSPLSGKAIFDYASLFAGGRITDNVGAFAQLTYSFHDQQSSSGAWTGHFGSDNTDIRFADHLVGNEQDLVYGFSLNNNPGVQDVWNSAPVWSYPYVTPSSNAATTGSSHYLTVLETGFAQQVVGLGAYAYWNHNWYAELTAYRSATGPLSALAIGNVTGDSAHPKIFVEGYNPYIRLAYTQDWGNNSLMVGLTSFKVNNYQNDSNSHQPQYALGTVKHTDTGLDAQYQYLAEPYTATAQVRWIHERISDPNNLALLDQTSASLNSFRAKASLIYQARFGASLSFFNVSGTSDSSYNNTGQSSTAVASAANAPNTRGWTPEVFWLPEENIRVGLQYTAFTKFLGASTNYDGAGRNASDNNTVYLYGWYTY